MDVPTIVALRSNGTFKEKFAWVLYACELGQALFVISKIATPSLLVPARRAVQRYPSRSALTRRPTTALEVEEFDSYSVISIFASTTTSVRSRPG